MKIKLSDQMYNYHLEVSIGEILSLNTKQGSIEQCITCLLREVLLVAKESPETIDVMLKDI